MTEQLHFTSGKEGPRVAQGQLLGPAVTHLPYRSVSQNREGAEGSAPPPPRIATEVQRDSSEEDCDFDAIISDSFPDSFQRE